MFHFTEMFADSFAPQCRITELTEHRGKKAKYHYYGKSNNLTETAKYKRYSKRYEYGKQPAKEKQHFPVKITMFSLAPIFGDIPHIVYKADPVFAIALFHTVISIQKNKSWQ